MSKEGLREFKNAIAVHCLRIEDLWTKVYGLGRNPLVTVIVRDPQNFRLFTVVTNEGADMSKVIERLEDPQFVSVE